MKAWVVSDIIGNCGSIIVFAKTRIKAHELAFEKTDAFEDCDWTDIKVKRFKAWDNHYKGKEIGDWEEDKLELIRDFGWNCLERNYYWCKKCKAKLYCNHDIIENFMGVKKMTHLMTIKWLNWIKNMFPQNSEQSKALCFAIKSIESGNYLLPESIIDLPIEDYFPINKYVKSLELISKIKNLKQQIGTIPSDTKKEQEIIQCCQSMIDELLEQYSDDQE